jgi:predicted DCC family thiol-disulfide oxidoreductase YuxK
MKTLHNHLILFDEECPLCVFYTKAMVTTGMLDDNGRAAYQQLEPQAYPSIDRQRAVDEIALVDKITGEVTYGVESLFKILGNMAPLLKPILLFEPFVWVMKKLYAFVSYNRRVIIPAPDHGGHKLQPTFKLHYRIAYLLLTWAATAYILTAYVPLLHGLLPQGTTYREYLICGGQLFFQGAIVAIYAKDKVWAYLGNMMTISFAGGLLLLPALLVARWFSVDAIFYGCYFFVVAGLMLLEHIRRSKLLQTGWALTISWACYRVVVLILIFLSN